MTTTNSWRETTCGTGASQMTLTQAQARAWRAMLATSITLPQVLSADLQEQAGISLSEYQILVMLSEAPDHQLRMSSLAEVSGLSRSRLSHTVARLEERGWLQREHCVKDGRGINCLLTPAGESFLETHSARHLKSVKEHFLDQYSDQELTLLAELLTRVLEDNSAMPDAQ